MNKAVVIREPAPPPKIEKIIVELTLEEARVLCVMFGMTSGTGGYPLYAALQKIPEVYSEFPRIREVLRGRGYAGFCFISHEFD
jgi:hypothetical protein